MIEISDLPLVNATLNGLSLVLLLTGYALIKSGRRMAHRNVMIAAFAVSSLFLVSYLTYRFAGQEKKFGGEGWVRPVYFFILFSHIPLAATVPVFAIWLLKLGFAGNFEKHKRIARIALPIWVYVSVTGVLVYLFLFQWFGRPGAVSPAAGA